MCFFTDCCIHITNDLLKWNMEIIADSTVDFCDNVTENVSKNRLTFFDLRNILQIYRNL